MPTYEYQCTDCGERFDVVQKFTDKPLKKHTECGGALQKVFHASGVVFKGSGYYVTDSRSSKSSSPNTSTPSDASTASENGSSSDAPSKTEKKASESKTKSKTTKTDSSAAAD